MKRNEFSLEIFGERLPTVDVFGGESNSRRIELMKKTLSRAIETELTDRQKQMIDEYYFAGKTMTEIGKKYGISKSTVSRHLSRSRERLKTSLKYGIYMLWSSEA